MEQTALMMSPKPAGKEEEIADAIARHGEDYKLSEAIQKVALDHILMGKNTDIFDLWESEESHLRSF